jgi:hypothetical protein
MIGDAPPQPPSYTDQGIFWKDEIHTLYPPFLLHPPLLVIFGTNEKNEEIKTKISLLVKTKKKEVKYTPTIKND